MKSPTRFKDKHFVNKVRILHQSGKQSQIFVEKGKAFSAEKITNINDNQANEKLFIGNMVSFRCIRIVASVLENLGLNYASIKLGEVEIIGKLSQTNHKQLHSELRLCGFELIDDYKLILIEKIKIVIMEMIHSLDEMPIINISNYLSQVLNLNYIYLSNLFSEINGMSIQQFIISYKIEKLKELLLYDELSLKEISYRLHYSSVAHLSTQFKKMTGLSPSQFKNVKFRT